MTVKTGECIFTLILTSLYLLGFVPSVAAGDYVVAFILSVLYIPHIVTSIKIIIKEENQDV